MVGDLLATQAKGRGVAAVLVDAAVRDVAELRELGLPIWARFVRVRGADKAVRGTIGEPVEVGGATIRQGDIVVLDEDGAVVVEAERLDEVLAAARADREGARQARAAPGGRALVRPRRPAEARRAVSGADAGREPLHDIARIGHVELLTPKPEESLRFFVEVLGHGGGGTRGAVGVPARMGRLPALQPQADRVAGGRARARGTPRLEPARARAPRRRDRGDRPGDRLDRRRRRPRPRLPRSRIPTVTSSSSITRPNATSRRSIFGPRGATSRSATSAVAPP